MHNILRSALFGILLLAAVPGPVPAASGIPRPDPQADTEIPLRGYPLYVEWSEVGSPVSDYGSHYGFKAGIRSEGTPGSPSRVGSSNLLNALFYSTRGDAPGKMDHLFVWLKEESPGTRVFFTEGGSRSLTFFPWGWEETVSGSPLSARAFLTTLQTDTFLLAASIQNTTGAAITVSPRLTVVKDQNTMSEFPILMTYGVVPTVSGGMFLLQASGSFMDRQFDHTRAVAPSFPLDTLVPFSVDSPSYAFTMRGAPLTIPAGSVVTLTAVIAITDTAAGAQALAASGQAMGGGDPWDVRDAAAAGWEAFYSSLPPPHGAAPEDRRIFRQAAAGLRMNLYAPRGSLPGWVSVPGKVHFNGIYGWDTPFHTIGIREWSPVLAMENLSTQAAGLTANGRIPNEMDDTMSMTAISMGRTQPPVQGWTIRKIRERAADMGVSPADLSSWTESMYAAGKTYMEFWFRERDVDKDGLPEYVSGLESGWDDTPRLPLYPGPNSGARGVRDATSVDTVDLACWIIEYYRSLGEMAESLGRHADAGMWREKEQALTARMVSAMWSESDSGYFDAGAPRRVNSPAMFWPLFLGIERDPARARALIETHLLNPAEFWGNPSDPVSPRWPIPTVAYNDPSFNYAQDGYYWQGQIWLITNYAALQALYRYGYEKEADLLRSRTLRMVAAADPGGIHETYDSLTGKVGWGSQGPGESSVFQFGWSSAFLLEMLLDRHQAERYLMPGETSVAGYVRRLEPLAGGSPWYQVDAVRGEVPRSRIAAMDGAALGRSVRVSLALTDPSQSFGQREVTVRFPLYSAAEVTRISVNGAKTSVPVAVDGTGVSFVAQVMTDETTQDFTVPGKIADHYEIVPSWAAPGCSCRVSAESGPLSGAGMMVSLAVVVLGCLALRRRREGPGEAIPPPR